MKTCRKILTSSGPLYRQGGFYIEEENGDVKLCLLLQVRSLGSHQITIMVFFAQIYKDGQGYSYAVAELLRHAPEKEDIFLTEVKIKVFRRTGRLILLEALDTVCFFKKCHLCSILQISDGSCASPSCLFC